MIAFGSKITLHLHVSCRVSWDISLTLHALGATPSSHAFCLYMGVCHLKCDHFREIYCILVDLLVYKTSSISPRHHESTQRRQKAWDDGVAPSVKRKTQQQNPMYFPTWGNEECDMNDIDHKPACKINNCLESVICQGFPTRLMLLPDKKINSSTKAVRYWDLMNSLH